MIVYLGLMLLYFQDEYELSVKPDDVLITATDGLLDNVPQEMICGIMDGATAGTVIYSYLVSCSNLEFRKSR